MSCGEELDNQIDELWHRIELIIDYFGLTWSYNGFGEVAGLHKKEKNVE